MRMLALVMATILAVVSLAACGGGGAAPAAPEARAGEWEGATEFGTFTITVDPSGNAVTRIKADWSCGGPVGWSEEMAGGDVFPIPIGNDGKFDIEITGGPHEGWRLEARFEKVDDTATRATGVWTVPPSCSEKWEVTATAAPAGTPRATAIPSEAGTPAATPAPSEAGLAPGSLSDLDSYRYSMKMELKGLESLLTEGLSALPGQEPGAIAESIEIEVSGAFVAPDKAEAHMSISGIEGELGTTVIGNEQWMEWGDLVIGPEVFTDDISEMDLAAAMWEGFSEEAGGLTCASEKKETVNNVPSRYCGIDKATFEQLTSLFGTTEEMGDIDEMSLDMWLAEDGDWPVRLRVHVAGTDESGQEFEAKLEMDITDVNEKIDIEPPS